LRERAGGSEAGEAAAYDFGRARDRMAFTTWSSAGKPRSRFFEKRSCPSTVTSKMPFAPLTSFGSLPSACRIWAARLAALGR